jgi:membrane-bound serine protease (ClpP class)
MLLLALILTAAAVAIGQETAPATDWPTAPEGARLRDDGWFAPRTPAPASEEEPAPPTLVYWIKIEGGIQPSLVDAIKRKVTVCRAKGAEMIIFEMNTPGGDSISMESIAKLIAQDLPKTQSVVYVNSDAYSAGAVISLACDQIVMGPASKIGAATPIMIGRTGELVDIPPAERAKFESAARAEARSLAELNGHNIALAEAMITKGIVVWMIRNDETGQLRLVDPDKDNWQRSVKDPPSGDGDPQSPWTYVETLDDEESVVVLTGSEAYELGLADAAVADREELLSFLGVEVEPIVLLDTWSEKMAAFLTSPAVAGLLTMVGILGVYLEIRTPGFGVPGIVGISCLALAFGSRYLTGMAQWWEIGLIVVGIILLILEFAVIPGFGVAGITGLACLVAGLMAVIILNGPDELPIPRTPLDWSHFTDGLLSLTIGLILAIAGAALLTKYMPRIPIANKLILAEGPTFDDIAAPAHDAVRDVAVGDTGVIEAICRPVGKARFGDSLVDVVTEGEHIDAGATIRVLKMLGNRIVVASIDNTEGAS